MQGATRQIATAFHYKITVSNESWLHVVALPWSCKILSVALQFTQLTNTSKYLCSTFGWSSLFRRSKSTNSSTKWQPPWRIVDLNRKIILFLPTDLIEDSVIIICCDLKVVCQFISPLAPLRPVVGLWPPSNSFILSFHLTITSASLSDPVQNTTPEGVPSKCWYSLTLTLTTSIGISHSAGVTKGVTSPAAHRGIWHGAGATRSWLHSPRLSMSFAVIEKSLNSTEMFHLDEKRKAQRWQSNTN